MSINTVLSKVGFQLKKHSPLILLGCGICGTVATVISVYKATPRLQEITVDVDLMRENGEEPNKADLIREYAKAVSLPFALGTFSLSCFIWSYNIQAGRITAMSSIVSGLKNRIDYIRDKAIQTVGEEKTKSIFDAYTEHKKEIETEDGKTKTIKYQEVYKQFDEMDGFWFKECDEYTRDSHDYNLEYAKQKISDLDLRLFERGMLTVNDVAHAFGLEPTKIGALMGWTFRAGFDIQVHNMWDDEVGDRIPQIYIHWASPEYVYDKTPYIPHSY